MNFLNFVSQLVRIRRRDGRLASRTQEVGVYLCSQTKPPVVTHRKIELFVKPRVAWTILQASAALAVGAWTVSNYMHVIRSLLR